MRIIFDQGEDMAENVNAVVKIAQLKTFKSLQDAANVKKFAPAGYHDADVAALKKKALSAAKVTGVGCTATFTEGTETDGATLSINVPTPEKYALTPATAEKLGGVKIGAHIGVATDGTINANEVHTLANTANETANAAKTSAQKANDGLATFKTEAGTTYLAKTDAAKTYATKDEMSTGLNRLTSAIIPKGSVIFASLPAVGADNLGAMYNVTNGFTTTASFVEGAGKTYPAGTNVVCVQDGGEYKWDAFSGMVDLSNYATKAELHTPTTVAAGAGVAVTGDNRNYTVAVKNGGVTADMLAGGIPATKLAAAVQTTLTQVDTNKQAIAKNAADIAKKQDALTFATDADINSLFNA